jgi:hypothetical protein
MVDELATPVSSSLGNGYDFEIETFYSSAENLNTFWPDFVDTPIPGSVIEPAPVQDMEIDNSEGKIIPGFHARRDFD